MQYNLWTPLHHAAIGNGPTHFACVKILVEAGCDVNVPDEYGKTPGWYAAWFGHVECLKYLLNAGAKLGSTKPATQGLKGPMANLGIGAFGSADSQDPSAMSPNSDLDLDGPEGEFEMIPSLSLPPPIIPYVFGNEVLRTDASAFAYTVTSSLPSDAWCSSPLDTLSVGGRSTPSYLLSSCMVALDKITHCKCGRRSSSS